jgi:hypothetical protein
MPRVFPRNIPISKPKLSQPAVRHLASYLGALPEERTRLVDGLTGSLCRLLGDEGDRLEINHWRPPLLPKKGSRSKKRIPPHIHSSVISPEGFYVIDREPFPIEDPKQRPKRLHFKYQDFETSPDLATLFEWVHKAYRSRRNDTFFIQQGDRKTGGRLNALADKHPELFIVLEGLYKALNDLPPGWVWYPKYERLERGKAFANRRG